MNVCYGLYRTRAAIDETFTLQGTTKSQYETPQAQDTSQITTHNSEEEKTFIYNHNTTNNIKRYCK